MRLKVMKSQNEFGCHIDAAEQQRALNFELVVSDQLFSVIFSLLQLIQNSAPSVARRHQCDIQILTQISINFHSVNYFHKSGLKI